MQEFPGVCFRPTGGVSGIHMSEDYFGLGGGIGLKLGGMIGGILVYHCALRHVCAFVWVSVHEI